MSKLMPLSGCAADAWYIESLQGAEARISSIGLSGPAEQVAEKCCSLVENRETIPRRLTPGSFLNHLPGRINPCFFKTTSYCDSSASCEAVPLLQGQVRLSFRRL
jgi:hypothetical protein